MLTTTKSPAVPDGRHQSASGYRLQRSDVFDNAQVNIRGQTTQTSRAKPNWKIEMPKNHEITLAGLVGPVDEFAMQADFSDRSHGRPLLAWDSYATAGVVDTQVMPIRTQRNSQFQGLYTYVDLFDGTWRDREGYSNKQFFKAGSGGLEHECQPIVERRFEKKNPKTTTSSGLFGLPQRHQLDGQCAA